MNNIYKRGLFKTFLKDWAAIIFERQQEPTKLLRTFTSVKKFTSIKKNDYDVGNDQWYPIQLNSGEEYNLDNYEDDLLWLLHKKDNPFNNSKD